MSKHLLLSSWPTQLVLVAFASIAFVVIWSLPVIIMGDSYGIFPHLIARNFATTGIFSITDDLGRTLSTAVIMDIGNITAADGRLSYIVIAALSHVISWNDAVGWTMIGCAIFGAALWFWWIVVRMLFDPKTAWVTFGITGLMPAYFTEAIWFNNYNLALLFLAASATAYMLMRNRHPLIAFILAGLLFGASASSKDVFLIFVPWIAVTIFWNKRWQQGAAFFICAACIYLIPYVGNISKLGYPVNQNLARVWPGAEQVANETYLHLYPDPYTYYYNRENFDAVFVQNAKAKPLPARMSDEKLILSYGLEKSVLRRMRLGLWLLVKDVPPFFQRQTVGGIFVWIFAIPGFLFLWKKKQTVLLWLIGLTVSHFLLIRFVMLYERSHFMNIGWIFALAIGCGLVQVSSWQKLFRPILVVCILASICGLQLLQANRYEIAARYNKNIVPELRSTANLLHSLPLDSVIAIDTHPNNVATLALLSNRTIVLFREDTVARFPSALEEYGVTHALDYTFNTSAEDISSPPPKKREASETIKRLVHLIR